MKSTKQEVVQALYSLIQQYLSLRLQCSLEITIDGQKHGYFHIGEMECWDNDWMSKYSYIQKPHLTRHSSWSPHLPRFFVERILGWSHSSYSAFAQTSQHPHRSLTIPARHPTGSEQLLRSHSQSDGYWALMTTPKDKTARTTNCIFRMGLGH